MPPSLLEAWFDATWSELGGAEPVRDYVFADGRNLQLDRAFPDEKIAFEIQGRGHEKWNKWTKDAKKLNLAARLGWRILWITWTMVKVDGTAAQEMEETLRAFPSLRSTTS